jgi:hypothetical protein
MTKYKNIFNAPVENVTSGDGNTVSIDKSNNIYSYDFITLIQKSSDLSDEEKGALIQMQNKEPTFKDRIWGVLNSAVTGISSGLVGG